MEEGRLAQHQQQRLLQHHQHQQQQQQQQQQLLILQQQQKQHQHQHQHQHQAATSRFYSNIDVHLRPPGLHRQINLQQQHQNPTTNPNPNPSLQQHNPTSNVQQQQMLHQQQKGNRPGNQTELHMAYQDAWRVCHPDFKRPFSSLEDACERLLPYHVVADYEAEEDDRILDSDTTSQMSSRYQQWDHNIAAKIAEFTTTFEKQVLAFNIISRKRANGEFRSEETLMIEQALLQEEKRASFVLKAEIESREKAGREAHEAKLRMAAMFQAEQARAESQARKEMMARAPIRASALGPQGNNAELESHGGNNTDEMVNGWGNNNAQGDGNDEDFLNDEENENGDAGMQDEWREVGEFDLNTW